MLIQCPDTGPHSTAFQTGALHADRVPSSLRPIFSADSQPPDHMYSAEQVATALHGYACEQGLQSSTGPENDVKLDRFLASVLSASPLTHLLW